MDKKERNRQFFNSLISYDWHGNYELNKDIISNEYLALTFNGSIIMVVVLVIMAMVNFELGFIPLVKNYLVALPVLAFFIVISYYFLMVKSNFLLSHILVYAFAIFSFSYSIVIHMAAEDFGQQNLLILYIYIVLYPLLIVEKPIPKLIFNVFVTGVTWMLVYMSFSERPEIYLTYMSNLLIATLASYFFGCYTSWQKLIGFSKVKKEDYLSRHDEATGLRNRRNLVADFERYEQNGGVRGVVLMDINDFKKINDTYGHLIGDEAILHVATILKYSAKDHLIHYYRYGGDEFVGIVSNKCTKNMEEAGHYIQEQVLMTPLCSVAHGEIPLSISVGVAEKNEGESLESLLNRADEKMYEDKQRIKAQRNND